MKNTLKKYYEKFLALPPRTRVFSFFLLVAIFSIVLFSKFQEEMTPESADAGNERTVELATIAELSLGTTDLPILGTVTSANEAVIRSESSGRIVNVRKQLGDVVSAGEVIAYFENGAERAALLSAEGSYQSALAASEIADINKSGASLSLSDARSLARNTILSSYSTMDDAVRTKTDGAWQNPDTSSPRLLPFAPDSALVNRLKSERIAIGEMLHAREIKNQSLTETSDLQSEIASVEGEIKNVQTYLDDLSSVLNKAIPDTFANSDDIARQKANTAIARQAIGGSLSSVGGARNSLTASESQEKIASKNSGSQGSSIASAQVTSALGNLRGAEARLEQTIIRSPISGTINSLSVNTGDFISQFAPVAVVSNNGALEVVSNVTEEDARELSIGDSVSIGNDAKGVITRIASALDPATKKMEVRIGITRGSASLVNGQSVNITAARKPKISASKDIEFKIPLSALKLTPSGPVVFTVSASSTLVLHEVKEGALQGDKIVIAEGLTKDMNIVIDARGLEDGMKVQVKGQ